MKNNTLIINRMKSKVLKNVFFNLIYRIINIAIPLITSPYLSRTLGADAIGKYAYINSIAFYFFSFSMLGVNIYGSREIAKVQDNRIKRSYVFWQIFYNQFFSSIILSFLYILIARYFLGTCGIISYIMVIYVLSAAMDIDWFAFGLEKFKITTLARSISKVITTILIFLLIQNENDLWKYALIIQSCNFLNFFFIWPIVMKETEFQFPNIKLMFAHLKPNFILFLPVIASSAYLYIDKIMIGSFITKEELGYYNYAENIYNILCSINISASSVLLAYSSKLLTKDSNNFTSVYKTSVYISIVNIPIVFGTMIIADIFIPWYLGTNFYRTAFLLKILVPCVFLTGITGIIKNQVLIPLNMDKPFLYSIVLGALTNIILNFYFIPKYGATGAAITTLIAYTITLLIQIIMTKQLINYFNIFLSILPYLIIGLFMFVFLSFLGELSLIPIIDLILKVIIGGIIYVSFVSVLFIKYRTLVKNFFE